MKPLILVFIYLISCYYAICIFLRIERGGGGVGGGQVDFDGDTYGTPTQEIIKKKKLNFWMSYCKSSYKKWTWTTVIKVSYNTK